MSTQEIDEAWQQARQRLTLGEQSLDAITIRRLQTISIDRDWHCLDVGAGGGSIARWLCTKVGPNGDVMATDLDIRLLDAHREPNLQVLQHNIVSDDLPAAAFDLIHTRRVLMHLHERENVLARLVSALKPGGWLLLEEQDVFPVTAVACGPYARVWEMFIRTVAQNGTSVDWARRLPALLVEQGLTSVAADAHVPMFNGASPMAEYWRLSWVQVLERYLNSAESADDFHATIDLLGDPTEWFVGPALIGAWGRRPLAV